ncbi:MAG: hypothetical protein ACD_33C00005G0011 [uncultured bacterium]|nr:MAG: hypothetical protein ACD_33C00005G0011 [uncultured bacterium]
MNTKKLYTICKYAKDEIYESFYISDPKLGVNIGKSAYYTFTGKGSGIKLLYNDIEEANKDCDKLNKVNMTGHYAVCIVA